MERRDAARRRLTVVLILAGLTLWLALPAAPYAFVAARPAAQGEGELDQERRAKLDELLAQMKSGAPFSIEEADILRRYSAGQPINRLTADTLISRALYLYFVTRGELTREQEDLLARYSAASATREHDLADRKHELYEQRRAAAEASPPVPSVAPSNDLCAGAETIPGAGPFPYLTAVTADITDATTTGDPPAPNCTVCAGVTRSIWYRFTPSVTAAYTISTCQLDGTGTTVTDTEMAIYTSSTSACGGTFTQLPNNSGSVDGCDSDSCVSQAFQATITTQLNAGTSYFVVVWLCGSAPPIMGETAVQLLVDRVVPPVNDNCASATPLNLNIPVTGSTVAATNDYQLSGPGCFGGIGNTATTAPGRDVVYSFTAPSTGKYSFRVTNYGANLDPVLYVAGTCPAAPGPPVVVASCVGASNRTVPDATVEEVPCVNLSAGQLVFVFVDETFLNTNTGSTFTLEAQRCTQEAEPNNTPATATPFAFGMEGATSPAGDVDFISFGAVSAGSRVFALVDGAAGSSNDFDLRITTATDTLEYDDTNADASFGRFSGAVGGTPTPGAAVQVFARINKFSAAIQAEPYRFYAVVQPPSASATPESEPNDAIASADTAANRYFSGSLAGPAPSTDVDIFSFTASAGEVIFLGLDSDPLRNNTPINAKLALLDAGGNLLIEVNDVAADSNTAPGGGSLAAFTPISPCEALVFRVPASGTYYARVAIGVASVQPFGAGDYLLSITTGATGVSAVKFGSTPGASLGKATRAGGGVLVEWATAQEVDNLGFNVHRVENGLRAKVNSRLIAGSALMVGPRVSLEAGHSYAWLDKSSSAVEYWIEAIGIDGRGSLHGPIKVEAAGSSTASAMKAQSVLLNELAGERAGASHPLEARPEKFEVSAAVYSQENLGARPAIKIAVRQEGLYRVTVSELLAAGLNPAANRNLLQLFVDGREQPINVISDRQGGLAGIEFYGLGVDNAFTDARVYWLVEGTSRGRRMDKVAAAANPVAVGSFRETIERKDRFIYFSSLRNGEKENFFGDVVNDLGVDQSLTLRRVEAGAASSATLEVALQGITLVPHRVEVRVNGARAGEITFENQSPSVARFNIPHQSLKEGVNLVRLTALGGPPDASLVDYVRLTHSRRLTVDGDSLRLTLPAKQAVTIDGFGSGHVRVFDVTDPDGAQEVLGSVRLFKTHYGVSFVVPGSGQRRLIAMADERAGVASSINRNEVSNWRDAANEADLVIITRRDFFGALEPLKQARQGQGLKVALVDVEDVYDEFSFGQKTPRAIRDFLAHATAGWKAGPRYALFAGDASYDPKNYLGRGSWDFVPTKLIDTASMETASDDWLVDFDSDSLPDIAAGRLPVRAASAASSLVGKIIAYDQGAGAESMLLVTDANDGFDFETTTTALRLIIPPGLAVEEINRAGVGAATARAELLGAINRGQKVVNYIGHGSTAQWRASLLTSADAAAFTNAKSLSLFIAMTCLNGYFHDAGGDTLAEAVLKAERGGAVAVWASTGMTGPGAQSLLNQELFRLVFSGGPTTLGEALMRAKAAVAEGDVRRTWVLLGDPTTRLR